MVTRRNWPVTIGQLALASAWLMAGAVYIFTPARMAALLGMSDAVRGTLGVAMLISALVAAVGALNRNRTMSIVGLILLTVAGIASSTYDALHHWMIFTAYDGALAIVSICLLATYGRKS